MCSIKLYRVHPSSHYNAQGGQEHWFFEEYKAKFNTKILRFFYWTDGDAFLLRPNFFSFIFLVQYSYWRIMIWWNEHQVLFRQTNIEILLLMSWVILLCIFFIRFMSNITYKTLQYKLYCYIIEHIVTLIDKSQNPPVNLYKYAFLMKKKEYMSCT